MDRCLTQNPLFLPVIGKTTNIIDTIILTFSNTFIPTHLKIQLVKVSENQMQSNQKILPFTLRNVLKEKKTFSNLVSQTVLMMYIYSEMSNWLQFCLQFLGSKIHLSQELIVKRILH